MKATQKLTQPAQLMNNELINLTLIKVKGLQKIQ